MANRSADVVIIGAGIVGTAIARELSRYAVDVVILEKGLDVAIGTSKANSGILHSGVDAWPGSLKAGLNVRGLVLYKSFYEELGMDAKFTGSLIIARSQEELPVLEELLQRGRQNGVNGAMRIIPRQEVLAMEPNLDPNIAAALWTPSAGIICPYGATLAFARNAVRNGVRLITGGGVTRVIVKDGRVHGVETSRGIIKCRYIVNAAGVDAASISRSAGDDSFSIQARKGEYILFDKAVGELVNRVIFPTPNPVTKGILVAPTTHGNYFVGPNAADAAGRPDLATSRQGLEEIVAGARRLVPGIPLSGAITQFAGLRAVADGGDFVIRPSTQAAGLIHAAGIQSPGLTAAPAIAEMVAGLLADAGLTLKAKPSFQPVEPRPVRFRELDYSQRDRLVKDNPLYGRIICRCERVSEGEIVDAVRGLCGARTLDGVKRRTRAGMGRCQGGFCSPRVAAILARELGVRMTEICKENETSALFVDKYIQSGVPHHAESNI